MSATWAQICLAADRVARVRAVLTEEVTGPSEEDVGEYERLLGREMAEQEGQELLRVTEAAEQESRGWTRASDRH